MGGRDLVFAARSLVRNRGFLARSSPSLRLESARAPRFSASPTRCCFARRHIGRPSGWSRSKRRIQDRHPIVPVDDYSLLSARHDLFEQIVPYRRDDVIVKNDGVPDQIFAARTSTRLFSMLGVRASLGRTLADSDDKPNAPNAALISDRLWHRMFNADPHVIGHAITVDAMSTPSWA